MVGAGTGTNKNKKKLLQRGWLWRKAIDFSVGSHYGGASKSVKGVRKSKAEAWSTQPLQIKSVAIKWRTAAVSGGKIGVKADKEACVGHVLSVSNLALSLFASSWTSKIKRRRKFARNKRRGTGYE